MPFLRLRTRGNINRVHPRFAGAIEAIDAGTAIVLVTGFGLVVGVPLMLQGLGQVLTSLGLATVLLAATVRHRVRRRLRRQHGV